MRVLITGASGLIGRALKVYLENSGNEIVPLARKAPSNSNNNQPWWNPEAGELHPDHVAGFDAIVHLAGDNIASGRWTPDKKRRIFDSRVTGTSLLCNTLAACGAPPKVLISASAIGYYGHRGDEILDEDAPAGQGFLAETCLAWEGATQPASETGMRVVRLRTGMVLSGAGGALPRLLTPFRLGLGGPIGTGRAWMSWIALTDMTRLIAHCIQDDSLTGPINAVAPHPLSNLDFTRALARTLKRPAVLPVPPLALRLAFGEMAREVLLASTRVLPARLLAAGFSWEHPEIESALQACLRDDG